MLKGNIESSKGDLEALKGDGEGFQVKNIS